MGRPRESPRLAAERAHVEEKLGGMTAICSRCGATLATYADRCSASLSEACPGFLTIEMAKETFNQTIWPKMAATKRD